MKWCEWKFWRFAIYRKGYCEACQIKDADGTWKPLFSGKLWFLTRRA